MDVSDSVTVIKQGKVIGNMLTKDTSTKEIARLMVGRDVLLKVDKEYKDYSKNDIVYQLDGVTTINNDGIKVVNNVSFNIRKGEIVGIAGVEGNGQSELLDILTGVLKSTSGKAYLNGKEITNFWPRRLRDSKIAFIPEDRYEKGLCKDMLIKENIIAGYHGDKEICNFGIISQKKMCERLDNLIDKYDIRVSDKDGMISSLSGGNAQKIIIAREFNSDPDVLIAAQPTRGVDIGAIEYIHNSILRLQKAEKSILLVSSELSEIMNLSDRILVMYKGEIIGEVDAKSATREEIGLLMAGIRKDTDNE
jgi:simple sugar transport system ATP-binding protein